LPAHTSVVDGWGQNKKEKNRWVWNGYWAAAKTLPESLSFCDPKPNAPTAIIATKTVAKCVGFVSTFCHRTPQNTAYTTHPTFARLKSQSPTNANSWRHKYQKVPRDAGASMGATAFVFDQHQT